MRRWEQRSSCSSVKRRKSSSDPSMRLFMDSGRMEIAPFLQPFQRPKEEFQPRRLRPTKSVKRTRFLATWNEWKGENRGKTCCQFWCHLSFHRGTRMKCTSENKIACGSEAWRGQSWGQRVGGGDPGLFAKISLPTALRVSLRFRVATAHSLAPS